MSDRRPENRELTALAIRDTVRRVFRQGYSEDEDILLLWQAAEAHAECLDDPVAVVRRGVESGTIKGEVVEIWHPGGWSGAASVVKKAMEDGIYIIIGPVSDGGSET